MSESAIEVYVRLLLPNKFGYPLWYPDPSTNLPEEYKQNGISIGDVGILSTDRFGFLFNIRRPANDPINGNRVPCGFAPIQELLPQDIDAHTEKYPRNHAISSSSVKKHTFEIGIGLTVFVCTPLSEIEF